MIRDKTGEEAGAANSNLIRIGGVAAILAAALILGEVVLFAMYPQAGTVDDWFALFQSNRILGLLEFWGLEVLMYLAYVPVFLALHTVLGKGQPGRATLAVTLALLGVGVFLATNNPFSMLSLSDRYAAAATDAERSMFLSAGQALLAGTGQRVVGGFNTGLFLVSVAGLLASTAMLTSGSFGKATAWVGIFAHGLSLIDYLREALTHSEIVALLVILPNALLLILWYFQVGRSLWRIGHPED